MQLRDYQKAQLEAIESNYLKGIRQQVVSAATGTGKSVSSAHIPIIMHKHLPGQTMLIVHRDELLDQNIEKLRLANPTLKVSKEKAEHVADTESDIIVASVQTVGRAGSKRVERFNWDNIDKIITDECHHATGDSYNRVYIQADVLRPDTHKLHVGFSATTQRYDGKALAKIFRSIVHEYGLRKAIEDKWLVDVKGIRVSTGTSLDSIKTVAGDYEQKALADTVNTPERNQLVVKAILEHAKDRQIIVFCVDIKHSQDMCEMLKEYSLNSECVWGIDPDRAEKLARFKLGQTQIITNCNVLTEGYDCPNVSCIVLARPTKSPVLFTQMCGRGTRLFEGKTDCLILDMVDSSSRHSLVTLPTLMGLSSGLNLQGGSLIGAVKRLEDAQKQYAHLDFSKLVNIGDIEKYIEEIDLFNITYTPDVENNSELSWHRNAVGGYIILLPNKEQVTIQQDLLDKYIINGEIGGKKYKGTRESIGEAFQCADNLIFNQAPDVLKIIKREGQQWHGAPATAAQLKFIHKLFKGKPIPVNLTKGRASQIISSRLAGTK